MVDQLIYISTARHALARRELPAILESSQRNNRRGGVTGMLLFDGIRFLQALEGAQGVLVETFDRLCADPRHSAAVVLSHRQVPAREFGSWDMAYESNLAAPGAVSLVKQVEALVARVESQKARELFRSFARVKRTSSSARADRPQTPSRSRLCGRAPRAASRRAYRGRCGS